MPPAAGDDALGVFVRRKSPSTNAERVLCLGYFLARQVGQSQFRTRDLSRLNDGAGLEKFTNTAMAVKAARLKGWLTVKGGVIALTSVGTQLVEALPNRTAALVQSRAAAVRSSPPAASSRAPAKHARGPRWRRSAAARAAAASHHPSVR